MFYCEKCGREFEELMTILPAEPRGLKQMVCPFCLSIDVYHSIGKCDDCGEFVYPTIDTIYRSTNHLGLLYCGDCMERMC